MTGRLDRFTTYVVLIGFSLLAIYPMLSILFLAIGCSGLGYLFWYGALEKVEVSRVASLLYLEPLVTFATAIVLLHEPVSLAAVAGGVLVLASVVATQYAPAVQRNGAAPVME